MSHKIIRIHVSEDLIKQALAFPDDLEIVNICKITDQPGVFAFDVEHESFPKQEGGIPLVSPVYHADHEKRPSTWLTIDWNLPDQPIADS